MMKKPSSPFLLAPLLVAACAAPSTTGPYPEAPRAEVTDDYHGTIVADPYRWLESSDTPEVRQWIDAQNELTREHLDGLGHRDEVYELCDRLSTRERYGIPELHGEHYYFSYNDGVMGQSLLVRATDPGASIEDCEVVLDPNSWSDDGTISLGGQSFSQDGRYLAYGLSDGGSDWRTWRVRDLDRGIDLPDKIEWTRFTSANWDAEGTGFFYQRFPETENELTDAGLLPAVYHHKLGTPQSEDTLVYEDASRPERSYWFYVTEDRRYEVMYFGQGTTRKNDISIRTVGDTEWTHVFADFDAQYLPIGNDSTDFWFWTNKDAPLGRVVKVDCSKVGGEWTEIVPEGEHLLDDATLVGGRLLCHYLVDAQSELHVFESGGAFVEKVDLPAAGSLSGMEGKERGFETFIGYSSFANPGALYRYDVMASELTKVRQAKGSFDASPYTARQVFAKSADGTRVPVFLVHKRGLEKNGDHPVLLYGYGGFNIPMRPSFSTRAAAWLELGGVYAVACLRGGGEYGNEWYRAGTLERKQNVFDDFIAVAEDLVDRKITRPGRIAILGGSNGGLLVGACVNQRPYLFGAAIPAVGVMDMLRYHTWTIGIAWASDYGLSSDPEMFPHLLAYSPVHNAKPGTQYPAVLVTTADRDDRVVPFHSFKYAAAMQHAQAGEAPVLIRIDTRAGHGAGKSKAQRLEEMTDQFSFLVEHLGM